MRHSAYKSLGLICILGALGSAPACQAETWLSGKAKVTDRVVFTPFQGGSRDAHDHTDMAAQMTGLAQPWEAAATDPGTIRRLLGAIRYRGDLSNGRHWSAFYYYEHLEQCPQINIELDVRGKHDSGYRQYESLRLYLFKFRGHYWLERGGHAAGLRSRGGMAAVEPQSLRRFLGRFRALVAQARGGGTRLTLFYPQGD